MYKIGIIGAGSIVESCHLPVLNNIQNIRAEWIMDLNITRATLLKKMYGVKNIINHKNWQKAIDDVDICLLTIPYGARKEYIEYVAEKGKTIYVEKPFAISLNEHQQYCSLFPDYNLSVGFQRRYYKTVHVIKSIIQNKVFGKLTKVSYNQGYFNLKGGSSYISNAQLSGGGVLIESAIHAFDQLLLLLEAIDFKIIESKQVNRNGIDYETYIETSIINKANESINLNSCISSLRNLDNGLLLSFEDADVMCELSPDSKIFIIKNEVKYQLTDERIDSLSATSVSQSFYIFWNQFLKAVENKTENLTSATTSLLTTKFIEAIYGNSRK